MTNGTRFLLAGFAAGAAVISGTASATELDFSYVTFSTPFPIIAEWTQSSSPVPLSFMAGNSTTVAAMGKDMLLFSGVPFYNGLITSVTFNSTLNGGGFTGADVVIDFGSQIYTGSEAAPMFNVGVVVLQNGTLTITAVPEPAGWAMMLVGFGVIGAAARRRQRVGVSYN